jgi:hypothetical protein
MLVLGLRRISLQEDVGVRVDQARKNRPLAQVDQARSRGNLRADALDRAPAHDDDRRLDVASGLHVEKPRRLDRDGYRLRRRGGRRRDRKCRESGEGERVFHRRCGRDLIGGGAGCVRIRV